MLLPVTKLTSNLMAQLLCLTSKIQLGTPPYTAVHANWRVNRQPTVTKVASSIIFFHDFSSFKFVESNIIFLNSVTYDTFHS